MDEGERLGKRMRETERVYEGMLKRLDDWQNELCWEETWLCQETLSGEGKKEEKMGWKWR